VSIAGVVAGVDAGHVDGDVDRRLVGIGRHLDVAARASKPAPHLREDEMATDEADLGVAGIEHPRTDCGELYPIEEAGR
jgi:hypothetical protein